MTINLIKRFWPSLIVVAVILYATLWPDPAGIDNFPAIPHLDKLIHAIMFGGLAGALAFDATRWRGVGELTPWHMAVVCIASALFGGVIEVVQEAMGLGRGCDIFDFCADTVGAIVAFFAAPPAIRAVLRNKQQ